MSNGERLIVSRTSAFQSIRLTEDAAGLRTLRFGEEGASQSVVKADDPRYLALPYARLLPACLAFAPKAARVLIVGLGGGSLPRFFHSHFPGMTIDVVELDADVVALAKEYCGVEEDARLRVFVDDGRDFIEAVREGYDVIVLDSFDTDAVPAHLTTLECLVAVREALTSEGIVVANVWGRAVNPLYASMLRTYQEAFEDVYILDVPAPGTKLFIGLSHSREMTRDALLEKAREISCIYEFRYDLAAVIAGFRNSTLETIRGGDVLRD